MIDLRETAECIVNALKNSGFNNIQDSSGYYIIKEFDDNTNITVDVSKWNENGKEYYCVYCSYENEDGDWKTTDNLSIESLLEVLQETADSKPL